MTPQVESEFAKAIPVALGALIGMFAAIVSQVVGHWFTKKRETEARMFKIAEAAEILRRERLELLVAALYDFEYWCFELLMSIHKSQDEQHAAMIRRSPLDKAKELQALYFPELSDELKLLRIEEVKLLEWYHKWAPGFNAIALTKSGAADVLGPIRNRVVSLTAKCRELLPRNTFIE